MTIIVVFAVVAVAVLVIGWAWPLLEGWLHPEPPEPAVSELGQQKARVLLHAAHRERQLAELDRQLRDRAETHRRAWEREDWS